LTPGRRKKTPQLKINKKNGCIIRKISTGELCPNRKRAYPGEDDSRLVVPPGGEGAGVPVVHSPHLLVILRPEQRRLRPSPLRVRNQCRVLHRAYTLPLTETQGHSCRRRRRWRCFATSFLGQSVRVVLLMRTGRDSSSSGGGLRGGAGSLRSRPLGRRLAVDGPVVGLILHRCAG